MLLFSASFKLLWGQTNKNKKIMQKVGELSWARNCLYGKNDEFYHSQM